MKYAQLHSLSNFSFLQGASHPKEIIATAKSLGYTAIALSDECSLAGIIKAHTAAKDTNIKLIVGSHFTLSNGFKITAIAPSLIAYTELSGFITLARRRANKGSYEAHLSDLRFRLQHCLIIWHPLLAQYTAVKEKSTQKALASALKTLSQAFKKRLWIGVNHQQTGNEAELYKHWNKLSQQYKAPLLACPQVLMHHKDRKPLQDVLCAIKENTAIDKLGTRLQSNAEAALQPLSTLKKRYPQSLIDETYLIEQQCLFSLDELRYQYPKELIPTHTTPSDYLRALVDTGKKQRWPQGVDEAIEKTIQKELTLIKEMGYEYFFLTVYDIVQFAQKENILYQGRGSAANSVVCYCLFITEISPHQINVLFERFISKERNEPPDIDVDFEHQRREEVIQYIYSKYSRKRAALAATVITYRPRSAIRDVGKALDMEPALVDQIAKSLAWWDRKGDLKKRIQEAGLQEQQKTLLLFFALVEEIQGFPRHLSQHVGGFIITEGKTSDLVPLENASMPDRTIIQWDKEDLEAMCLLKVDVLALGMLTALRKGLTYINHYTPSIRSLADIPKEDKATYDMLSQGDSIGVFQVESRAQMSMLPRLRPQCFYDLVIEIAIVRPGPIQGDMVHPYLRRRDGTEAVTYENPDIESVLERTLGIPIFQEQAIRLAMVAAGFSGGEADALRRAMASWGKNGNLLQFEERFIKGMLTRHYSLAFAQRLFEQIKGFGGYGFPESHSASFALLCYYSSWIKRHHPAAFYCALLNSQPMGFYSPSQLIQDAQRHAVKILPIDINRSSFDNKLELIQPAAQSKVKNTERGIRLGFSRIRSLSRDKAKTIEDLRGNKHFTSIQNLAERTGLTNADLQTLASADAFKEIGGNRHQARWDAASAFTQGAKQQAKLPTIHESPQHELLTPAPSIEEDVSSDYQTTGLSLRPHPMQLLRQETPFSRCKRQSELAELSNGRYVQVAGLVTGRQRPGTAKGTLFVTLEDETGNINIVVWPQTQEVFRQALLTSKLLVIKGRFEKSEPTANVPPVIHVIAGRILDYSERLKDLKLHSRDFH